LRETGDEAEAIVAASDNNKLLSGDRAKAFLAAARVLNGQQNSKDHPDFQIRAGDIANWKNKSPIISLFTIAAGTISKLKFEGLTPNPIGGLWGIK
jgi:hypothetical protein